MKILVIGHPEAVQGFSLVGVQGLVGLDVESMNHAVDLALNDPQVGIVLVTDDSAELIRDRITYLKNRTELPIFIEIPDPNGMNAERVSLREIAHQAIGIGN